MIQLIRPPQLIPLSWFTRQYHYKLFCERARSYYTLKYIKLLFLLGAFTQDILICPYKCVWICIITS